MSKKYCSGDFLGPGEKKVLLIERTKRVGKIYYANFECPYCGKLFETRISSIVSGNTFSCGCYNDKTRAIVGKDNCKNLLNKRFGKLVVIEKTNIRKNRRVVWKCKCDCGNICYVSSRELLSEKTKSCGCLKSYGEYKIRQILEKNNISFIKEANFETCINPETRQRFRFDFLLPKDRILIECNGLQHYRPVTFFGGEEEFKKRICYDNLKKDWALKNNYSLLNIKYKDESDIKENEILTFIKENRMS